MSFLPTSRVFLPYLMSSYKFSLPPTNACHFSSLFKRIFLDALFREAHNSHAWYSRITGAFLPTAIRSVPFGHFYHFISFSVSVFSQSQVWRRAPAPRHPAKAENPVLTLSTSAALAPMGGGFQQPLLPAGLSPSRDVALKPVSSRCDCGR